MVDSSFKVGKRRPEATLGTGDWPNAPVVGHLPYKAQTLDAFGNKRAPCDKASPATWKTKFILSPTLFRSKELILLRVPGSRTKKSAPPNRKQTTWLTPALKRKITGEAKALGISRSEYIRLVVSISESLRNSIQTKDALDWKQVAKWADSPLWPMIMGIISQTVSSVISEDEDTKTKETSTPPFSQSQQVPRPGPAPGRDPVSSPYAPYPSYRQPVLSQDPRSPDQQGQRPAPPVYYNGYL